jgi:hypothetical protein
MASGSCVIDQPQRNPQRNLSRSEQTTETALPHNPFSLLDVTIELNLNDNFKHWVVPKEFTTSRKNGTVVITLCANVGYALMSGRVCEGSHQVKLAGDEADAVVHTVVVPGFQPTLFDCLAATSAAVTDEHAALHARDTLGGSHFFPADDTRALGADSVPGTATVTSVSSTVWHATVEDLQLTSVSLIRRVSCQVLTKTPSFLRAVTNQDILDLYVDRSILVTAACGGAASLAPPAYLGNICRYQGEHTFAHPGRRLRADQFCMTPLLKSGIFHAIIQATTLRKQRWLLSLRRAKSFIPVREMYTGPA